MSTSPIQVTISSNGGPVRSGGMVQGSLSYLSSTSQGCHPVISPDHFRKALGVDRDYRILSMYEDRLSPQRCKERRGGPRSTIFCEQFSAGNHTEHVGRSSTGRWYTWRNDDFREQS